MERPFSIRPRSDFQTWSGNHLLGASDWPRSWVSQTGREEPHEGGVKSTLHVNQRLARAPRTEAFRKRFTASLDFPAAKLTQSLNGSGEGH